MSSIRLQWLAGVVLVVGIIFLLNGYGIRLKAIVAQYLLQSAWQNTITTKNSNKPWTWADSYPVGRLRLKRLDIDLIVQEGDRGAVLAFGPGHLTESRLPPDPGNCILAGHRDTSFAFLEHIQMGDIFELDDKNGQTHRYEVVGKEVKDRDDLYFDQVTFSWLTLITCYPFKMVNPGGTQRLVVSARNVDRVVQKIQSY
jgi:sortase A